MIQDFLLSHFPCFYTSLFMERVNCRRSQGEEHAFIFFFHASCFKLIILDTLANLTCSLLIHTFSRRIWPSKIHFYLILPNHFFRIEGVDDNTIFISYKYFLSMWVRFLKEPQCRENKWSFVVFVVELKSYHQFSRKHIFSNRKLKSWIWIWFSNLIYKSSLNLWTNQ